jgi:uncharacterized protein (DUF952 family)
MATIYHVTTKEEWNTAQQQGFYAAPSLETEGFIHCSRAEQTDGVLQRYFAGKKDLVKLTIDTGKLTSPLQYDLSPSTGEEFPHVYGPVNLDAVTAVEETPSFQDNGNA